MTRLAAVHVCSASVHECRGLVSTGAGGWSSCLIKRTQLGGLKTKWLDNTDDDASSNMDEVRRRLCWPCAVEWHGASSQHRCLCNSDKKLALCLCLSLHEGSGSTS